MKYISVCSGIEAATHAVEPLGWEAVAFSEVDPVCSRFLEAKYPNVRNVGDMVTANWSKLKANVLIGGTPCPSFSKMGAWRRQIVAAADPRGKLAFSFLNIADAAQVNWFLWENVANVIAAEKGEFFPKFLAKARQRGFNVGWRVLNTKDFGLPTLRPRLYVVGHRGSSSEIERTLFQPSDNRGRSLQADPKRLRQERRDSNIAKGPVVGFDAASIKPVGRSDALPTLLKGHATRVGLVIDAGAHGSWRSREPGFVRKLSPKEAERAMGFSDDYTNAGGLSIRERHEAIGNSFSPVIINAICEGIDGEH